MGDILYISAQLFRQLDKYSMNGYQCLFEQPSWPDYPCMLVSKHMRCFLEELQSYPAL